MGRNFDSKATVGLVQRFALFSGMSPADCTNIVSAAHERNFSRRQTIFVEGDPVQHVTLLVSGSAKVTKSGQSRSKVILRLCGAGELLSCCSEGRHFSTAQTLESSKALIWDAANFDALWERFPILWRNTERILFEHLEKLEERLRELSTKSVALRLGSELVRTLKHVGHAANGEVEIRLSREELAGLVGATPFTVSRVLCQWERRGIVAGRRREAVAVRNLQALIKLSKGDHS
jgi:CRP-like cAMP-binding protein